MMKTLCVAVVVLSLTSVCQPASLACEKLMKPVDKVPDLPGSWYLIAMSSDSCLVSSLLNSLLVISVEMDITSKDRPNNYDAIFKVKIYEHCTNESETFLFENNTIIDINSTNDTTGTADVLLQSVCPDCISIKGEAVISTFMLYSRRKTVTAAELKEFESQTACLGWYKPQLLNTDHDYVNCQSSDNDDDDIDTSGISSLIYQRLLTNYTEPLKCLVQTILYSPKTAFDWAQQFW